MVSWSTVLYMALPMVMILGLAVSVDRSEREVWRHVEDDRKNLKSELWKCGYTPHAISDAAWDMYRQGMIPRGTALYYTRIVMSDNIDAAACLAEAIPERWEGRDTSWKEPKESLFTN